MVGLQMGVEHVPDAPTPLFGKASVDADVARRIDHHGLAVAAQQIAQAAARRTADLQQAEARAFLISLSRILTSVA